MRRSVWIPTCTIWSIKFVYGKQSSHLCQCNFQECHTIDLSINGTFYILLSYVPWSKVAVLGMVVPPFIGILIIYINPYGLGLMSLSPTIWKHTFWLADCRHHPQRPSTSLGKSPESLSMGGVSKQSWQQSCCSSNLWPEISRMLDTGYPRCSTKHL